jgi:hypothetical protein
MWTAASPKAPKSKKAYCAQCGGERNCDIHAWYQQSGDPDEHFYWVTEWFILECRGCNNVFAQTVATNSEDYENYYELDGSTGTRYKEAINYWPALSKRPRPDWMSEYGITGLAITELDQPLVELYSALNNDLFSLSGIGIRTTFDVASELLGVDPSKTFSDKLDRLVTQEHIGRIDRDRLETTLEAGSASAHRDWQPRPDDLNTMMDILEHFISEAFIVPERKRRLDARAAEMKAKVPPRPRKTRTEKPESGT